MPDKTQFLDMFPCCSPLHTMCGGLQNAHVTSVSVSREDLSMQINAFFGRAPASAELFALSGRISSAFGLAHVSITPDYKKTVVSVQPAAVSGKAAASKGKVLMGRAIKGDCVSMDGLTTDSGKVTVRGEVFGEASRTIAKNGAHVLCFCLTDGEGSIMVSKYYRPEDDASIIGTIKDGMYLTVRGNVGYNRFDDDITLTPDSIVAGQKETRQDDWEGDKRVELHLHTRYSTLDALTDASAAVKRAAQWGHPAIAVTDHGVAQAFPEVWKAGKKNKIKVIYGVEGYFINDLDDRLAIHGAGDAPIDGDFVAFDLETTGLSAKTERITEIGAVIVRKGVMGERFQTFVNPGMPIPPNITELTGISDRDVYDAPSEAEAVRDFLAFAGGLPLVAHNADFDIGFTAAACERCGLDFDPVYMDTLTLSQSLLPDMKRHKLDLIAARLGLPEFAHHRASDDAVTCGHMMVKFIEMLKAKGAATTAEAQELVRGMRGGGIALRNVRHIILLVKNKTGLKNLYKLISKAHLEHYKKNPIIPKSLLCQYREGIIIGSACEAGEVFRAVLDNKSDRELRRIASFYDYLEIQPICNNNFLISDGKAKNDDELRDLNRRVVELADSMGKPTVATGDVHFLDPGDEIYRHILMAARKFSDADRELPIYFKTTSEMMAEFAYLGQEKCRQVVIDNPKAIADSVEEFELLPEGLFAPKIENSVEDLKSLVYGRMAELYGENPPEIIKTRIDTEMGDIIGRHYDVIYMSAQKLVANSLENGYLVGSRGSVGSSLVAYMSGITEVNSLPAHYRCPVCKHTDFESAKGYGCGADMPDMACPVCGALMKKDGFDIPFETFLGFGGDKVPDIDLNFSGEYQARAHKYTEELFGRDNVFRAGTIGTLAEKTAYGYVKKYLEERGKTVTRAEENRLAAGCVGVKRTTGQHPGGLVIIPQDMEVTDFCPVQHPADDPDTDIITTHFEYHSMEENLLKLDELGHDDPTMIRMLEDATGVNAREIPLDDHDTMEIFRSPSPLGLPDDDPIIGKTGTIGIPEFGTGFTRQMLVDTKPQDFDTLIRLSGFSHGTDVWAGNIRELVLSGTATVKETVGCRDDIMLYLISMGMNERRAFKYMEAVRKGAIHKGKPWPDGIVEEMQSLGVPEWYIESCRKIQYLFPKAHAVAYVMMAFRISWFKVHEPLAFYSAYFYRRSQKDSFDAASMTRGRDAVLSKIKEIQKKTDATAKEEDLLVTLEAAYEFYSRGFSFEKIDLYSSEATKFIIEKDKNALRPPFVAISGLGETAARDLVACREGGRTFISVEELSAACPKVSQSHLEQLKAMGALGDMPDSSQVSLFDLF